MYVQFKSFLENTMAWLCFSVLGGGGGGDDARRRRGLRHRSPGDRASP